MTNPTATTRTNLQEAADKAIQLLKAERTASGYWEGELSTSALSTATAVMALELVGRATNDARFPDLVSGGLKWLVDHQNEDGGWGDTVKSVSNISTTMLAHAVFVATKREDDHAEVVAKAKTYIDDVGGVEAVLKRYGDDHTFSVPILTHCALAGVVDWKHVIPLPFELAWVPAKFYKTVRLPVVSYALPALIAIGQVIFKHRKSWNPFTKVIRTLAIRPTLKVLDRIQPWGGGFLEATPLTSFVTMSLAGCGLAEHVVAQRGIEFIIESVRPDGSWPIDTNLATWVTTLSVNAIGEHLTQEEREPIRKWLLGQQYREVHPYTNADPGGWSWTDLSGGVPDADDSPGAMLALLKLREESQQQGGVDWLSDEGEADFYSLYLGQQWLLSLQNRDGGWPTFCRGWGKLPFDRSSPDISAHVLRALSAVLDAMREKGIETGVRPIETAIRRGFKFLDKVQRDDGSWLPLWFGNQFAADDENPLYGTARVLAAYDACGFAHTEQAKRGYAWIAANQNDDGGWGGISGTPSTVEETSLATESLLAGKNDPNALDRGLEWLTHAVETGEVSNPSPIGFYFAKLWYFEKLYPLIFAASALNKAAQHEQQG